MPYCDPVQEPSDGGGGGNGDGDATMSEDAMPFVQRVMTGDGSCLFRAISFAVRALRGPSEHCSPATLRRRAAGYILTNPQRFDEATLRRPTLEYCQNMLQPSTWGGEVEIVALSHIYQLQIVTISTRAGFQWSSVPDDTYPQRCMIMYSDTHYDLLAECPFPFTTRDFDVVVWSIKDSNERELVDVAKLLCAMLKEEDYLSTETDGEDDLLFRCDATGCEWLGRGTRGTAAHIKETGHTDQFEVVTDEEE
ncbi:hypothetical protein F4780DRAFT_781590 [Xylariomycetidae sp. FL0641]|nr:hypothetical protein F4780DRAFT_781590 [Xylariomycetidae sp. FL0641]